MHANRAANRRTASKFDPWRTDRGPDAAAWLNAAGRVVAAARLNAAGRVVAAATLNAAGRVVAAARLNAAGRVVAAARLNAARLNAAGRVVAVAGRGCAARRVAAACALWLGVGGAGCVTAPPASKLELRKTYPVHEVANGETIYSIARRHKVDVKALIRLNGLNRPERIFTGQSLLIPVKIEKPKKRAQRDPAKNTCRTARAAPAAWARSKAGLLWPIADDLTRRPQRNVDAKRGISEIDAPIGSAVWAAADGKVVYARKQDGYGLVVVIRHDRFDVMAVYGRLKASCVRVGARVRRGQVIALVGKPPEGRKPHLYFELRRGDQAVPSGP